MIKTLRFIGITLFAVVLCVNFAACSDDDEDTLAGTTWKVSSIDNNPDGSFDDFLDETVTFNADKTVTFKTDEGWTYTRWTLNGNTLKIVLGEGCADDYVEGTITINGKSATWDCYWADVDGRWTEKDEPHAMIHLQKL